MSATRLLLLLPTRSTRRATAPRRSKSNGSRCRMSSAARRRWNPARRWSGPIGRAISLSRLPSAISGETEKAFAQAARVVSLKLVNQRLTTNYLDTRGAIGEYDAAADHYTLTIGSQGSHPIRDIIAKHVLKIPPEKMRVITPDVGGGFGTKLFAYREYALVAVAAKKTGRPVKWIAERSEHFLGDTQGRDNITTARLALDDKGRFLALEVDTIADMGAYLSTYAPYIPYIGAGMLPGVYDIPICFIRVRASYTHSVPVDAYRGAGRPEASYVVERLVDVAAREVGMTPDALRRKNFIKPKQMPYETPTGKVYDTGEFAGHMARAQEIADWAGFKKRASAAKKNGKLRGIGLATYIEACGGNGPETATVNLDKDGGITLLIGTQSTGQGHATSYAQIIAEHLQLPPERVRMEQGDTARIHTGLGTGGSSSIPAGGASVAAAAKTLSENLKELGAEALEAAAGDVEIADGAVRISGTDRAISFADLAARPDTPADRLTASDAFVPPAPTYPNGTHLVEVEIDEATGETCIVNYVIVDDFGVSLNPLLLAGQVHGGTVQGIGQALMENTVYDSDSGQLDHCEPDGLCVAARQGDAALYLRDAQRAMQKQSIGRERRGRGGRHRLVSRGNECHRRCALAGLFHSPSRHAGDGAADLGRD